MFNGRKNGNGFQITYANGWTVSVQWSEGNYCKARNVEGWRPSSDAEVSAWKDRGPMETPKGWQTPAEVLAYMNEVAAR
jgi:hypothetical protein